MNPTEDPRCWSGSSEGPPASGLPDSFCARLTVMSAPSRKYNKLRRKLYAAYKKKDYALAAKIRDEMSKTWSELEPEEKYDADTCPGTPIPVISDDDPFLDAT